MPDKRGGNVRSHRIDEHQDLVLGWIEAKPDLTLAELNHHLAGDESGNRRNGYGRKTVLTEGGSMDLSVPRDRTGTFDPALIAKYQRRFPGFDAKIISMYARGMSTREITGHLRELYGIEVSADLISTVTDAVLEEVTTWQNRPLEATYPPVFLDAIRVKIRDEGFVRNKAIHVAISACGPMAPTRCWACGSSRTKGPSSGCAS